MWSLTGDSVVGGGEGGESLDVPQIDGLVQTSTGHQFLLTAIRQTPAHTNLLTQQNMHLTRSWFLHCFCRVTKRLN